MPVGPEHARIDPGATEPLYKQLASLLRQAIEQGRYGPGVALPSERRLMSQHAVTRSTVRSALAVLGAEGLVTPEQGAGVFVRQRPEPLPLDLSHQHSETGERHFRLGVGERPQLRDADAVTAARLEVALGSPVALWSGSVAVGGGREMLGQVAVGSGEVSGRRARSALPTAARFLPHGAGTPPELKRLKITGYTDVISARMPTPDELKALRIDQGVPVIEVTREWRSRGRIEAVGVLIAAADRTVVRLHSDNSPA